MARRRRWSDAFKAEVVARSFEPGTNVSALAREIGILPAQLFGWRADALRRGEVALDDDDQTVMAGSRSGRGAIEIVVKNMTIRVGAEIGEAHLGRVLRAVRSA